MASLRVAFMGKVYFWHTTRLLTSAHVEIRMRRTEKNARPGSRVLLRPSQFVSNLERACRFVQPTLDPASHAG
jgi:hypothetical protein